MTLKNRHRWPWSTLRREEKQEVLPEYYLDGVPLKVWSDPSQLPPGALLGVDVSKFPDRHVIVTYGKGTGLPINSHEVSIEDQRHWTGGAFGAFVTTSQEEW